MQMRTKAHGAMLPWREHDDLKRNTMPSHFRKGDQKKAAGGAERVWRLKRILVLFQPKNRLVVLYANAYLVLRSFSGC